MNRLYADHAATTPLAPGVAEAMAQVEFANPSSIHQNGRQVRAAIDQARETIAECAGCEFGEIVFTSGGTESAHLALVGAALAHNGTRRTILYGATEHHCVWGCADLLNKLGFQLKPVPVTAEGHWNLNALQSLLTPDVLLVAIMTANNETGLLHDVSKVIEISHEKGALVFCDDVQGLTLPKQADLFSLSAHKLYGPKATGILRIKAGTPIEPIIKGGGQERDMRAGTENVPGIIGMAYALKTFTKPTTEARDAFFQQIAQTNKAKRTISQENATLPGHAHILLESMEPDSFLIRLDRLGISASSGAACSSGSLEPSHVLKAMGLPLRGIRFSFGHGQGANEGIRAANATLEILGG